MLRENSNRSHHRGSRGVSKASGRERLQTHLHRRSVSVPARNDESREEKTSMVMAMSAAVVIIMPLAMELIPARNVVQMVSMRHNPARHIVEMAGIMVVVVTTLANVSPVPITMNMPTVTSVESDAATIRSRVNMDSTRRGRPRSRQREAQNNSGRQCESLHENTPLEISFSLSRPHWPMLTLR